MYNLVCNTSVSFFLGVEHHQKVGVAGLTLVALGLGWIPSSQSIIMSGYTFGKQGVVSGLVGQMHDIAVLPAYLISLSFTFNLKRGPGHVYWPGCAFGIVSSPCACACANCVLSQPTTVALWLVCCYIVAVCR